MAIIYGRAETEKDLLDISPNIVKKVEDIEIMHQELKNKKKAKKTLEEKQDQKDRKGWRQLKYKKRLGISKNKNKRKRWKKTI